MEPENELSSPIDDHYGLKVDMAQTEAIEVVDLTLEGNQTPTSRDIAGDTAWKALPGSPAALPPQAQPGGAGAASGDFSEGESDEEDIQPRIPASKGPWRYTAKSTQHSQFYLSVTFASSYLCPAMGLSYDSVRDGDVPYPLLEVELFEEHSDSGAAVYLGRYAFQPRLPGCWIPLATTKRGSVIIGMGQEAEITYLGSRARCASDPGEGKGPVHRLKIVLPPKPPKTGPKRKKIEQEEEEEEEDEELSDGDDRGGSGGAACEITIENPMSRENPVLRLNEHAAAALLALLPDRCKLVHANLELRCPRRPALKPRKTQVKGTSPSSAAKFRLGKKLCSELELTEGVTLRFAYSGFYEEDGETVYRFEVDTVAARAAAAQEAAAGPSRAVARRAVRRATRAPRIPPAAGAVAATASAAPLPRPAAAAVGPAAETAPREHIGRILSQQITSNPKSSVVFKRPFLTEQLFPTLGLQPPSAWEKDRVLLPQALALKLRIQGQPAAGPYTVSISRSGTPSGSAGSIRCSNDLDALIEALNFRQGDTLSLQYTGREGGDAAKSSWNDVFCFNVGKVADPQAAAAAVAAATTAVAVAVPANGRKRPALDDGSDDLRNTVRKLAEMRSPTSGRIVRAGGAGGEAGAGAGAAAAEAGPSGLAPPQRRRNVPPMPSERETAAQQAPGMGWSRDPRLGANAQLPAAVVANTTGNLAKNPRAAASRSVSAEAGPPCATVSVLDRARFLNQYGAYLKNTEQSVADFISRSAITIAASDSDNEKERKRQLLRELTRQMEDCQHRGSMRYSIISQMLPDDWSARDIIDYHGATLHAPQLPRQSWWRGERVPWHSSELHDELAMEGLDCSASMEVLLQGRAPSRLWVGPIDGGPEEGVVALEDIEAGSWVLAAVGVYDCGPTEASEQILSVRRGGVDGREGCVVPRAAVTPEQAALCEASQRPEWLRLPQRTVLDCRRHGGAAAWLRESRDAKPNLGRREVDLLTGPTAVFYFAKRKIFKGEELTRL